MKYVRTRTRSSERAPDLSLGRYCSTHPEVELVSQGQCPECAIRLLKIAARTLEQRADQEVKRTNARSFQRSDECSQRRSKPTRRRTRSLDRVHDVSPELLKMAAKTVERQIAELETVKMGQENDSIKKRSISGAGLVSANEQGNQSTAVKADKVENEDEETQALRCWLTDFDLGSSQGTDSSNYSPPPSPCSSRSNSPSMVYARSFLRPQRFAIGQVARRSEIDHTNSSAEAMIKIGRLNVGDPVWIKRSGDEWTYAILKVRRNGPNIPLVFTVNKKGATKTIDLKHLAKFVKLVADERSICGKKMNTLSHAQGSDKGSFFGTKESVIQDRNVSMYTISGGVNDFDEESDRGCQHSWQDFNGGDAQFFGDSMFALSGFERLSDTPLDAEESLLKCTSKSSVLDNGVEVSKLKHSVSLSNQPTLSKKSSFKDDAKPRKHRVIFSIPEGRSSSMPTMSESAYPKIFQQRRESGWSEEHYCESWSEEEIEQIKKEINDVKSKQVTKAIPKKKLSESNVMESIPRRHCAQVKRASMESKPRQHFEQVKRASFYSALNSIHKRSSM